MQVKLKEKVNIEALRRTLNIRSEKNNDEERRNKKVKLDEEKFFKKLWAKLTQLQAYFSGRQTENKKK